MKTGVDGTKSQAGGSCRPFRARARRDSTQGFTFGSTLGYIPAAASRLKVNRSKRRGLELGCFHEREPHELSPAEGYPKSSKRMFSGSTPRPSSMFMQAEIIIGGPHR